MSRRKDMSTRTARVIAASAVASLALAGSAQARHGADDPAGHQRHGRGADDAQPHAKKKHRRHHRHHRHALRFERRGVDDRMRDDRGRGRGSDDVQPHAKRGADDPAGDQRRGRGADDPAGDDRGGRGRGGDDPAGHR
jgi:hypothetical protein